MTEQDGEEIPRHRFDVNGQAVEVSADGDEPLLAVLRSRLGLTGTRFGCRSEQCGSCTVLIDGVPAYSCTRQIATVEGRSITTIEGLSRDGVMHPLQQALLDDQAGRSAIASATCR